MKLTIEKLTKTYANGTKALDSVSIEIKEGMFGLLGPNGAGKSTLMRTIATLQEPDSGSLYLNNINILKDKMALRSVLGYLPQDFGVYPRMSADRLLDYLAQLKGVSSRKERLILIDKCLELTNLLDVRKKSVSGYSGGMKQRFGIAQLLLNSPSLIIVDEPTAGLDPAERHRFLNILRDIGHAHIVLFSTHIVEDITDLCSDMAILNKGKICVRQAPHEGIDGLRGCIFTAKVAESQLPYLETKYTILSSQYSSGNTIQLRVFSSTPLGGIFTFVDPSLEDVYFATLINKHV